MDRTKRETNPNPKKLAYAKPSATFVELAPEERLMSCAKTTNQPACDDPIGSGFYAS